MTEQIRGTFEGEGQGVDDLSWGQRTIWTEMCYTGVSLSMGHIMPLRPGATVERLLAALQFAMARHQSLRTRLRIDADGTTTQVVHARGEIALEVIDVAEGEDLAQVAEEVRVRYQNTNFDYENEWPVRMGVLRRAGVLTHAVVMYSHLAFDALGFDALNADLFQWNRRGPALAPVTAMTPLEQVRHQRTPAARRMSESALRYWESILRVMPPQRFHPSDDPRSPRFWEASYRSPAMLLAVRRITARDKVEVASVLLAAFAVTTARITGINPAVMQVLANNRFRPGFADMVSPVMQHGLAMVDVADVPFREVVDRAWLASLGAFRNAYYDPAELDRLMETIGRERGEQLDISCFYNDRRRPAPAELSTPAADVPSAPEVLAEEVLAAVPRSELTWVFEMDRTNRTLFFHVDEDAEAISVLMVVDTHFVSPASLEAWLRGVEEILVQAAVDPAAETGVHRTGSGLAGVH